MWRGSPALSPGEGRIECDRQKARRCEPLRVEPGGLFLDGAERSAHGNGGQLALRVDGLVEIRGEQDVEAVLEDELAVRYRRIGGKYLVPFVREGKSCVLGRGIGRTGRSAARGKRQGGGGNECASVHGDSFRK